MSLNKIRIITRYIRKFFAGFVSVILFTNTRVSGYPFSRPINALDKDWLDLGSDIEHTKLKNKNAK